MATVPPAPSVPPEFPGRPPQPVPGSPAGEPPGISSASTAEPLTGSMPEVPASSTPAALITSESDSATIEKEKVAALRGLVQDGMGRIEGGIDVVVNEIQKLSQLVQSVLGGAKTGLRSSSAHPMKDAGKRHEDALPPDPNEPAPAAPAPPPPPPLPEPAQFQEIDADDKNWCPPEMVAHVKSICGLDPETFVYESNPKSDYSPAIPEWATLAGTRRGRSHATMGTYREDAWSKATDGEWWTVTAVSDGAGSCELSRLGSEILCRLICQKIETWCREEFGPLREKKDSTAMRDGVTLALQGAIQAAAASLNKLAAEVKVAPKEFSCTLLLAFLHRTADGDRIAFSQVGDGSIAALLKDNTTRCFTAPVMDQYGGLVPSFLPDAKGVVAGEKIYQMSAEHVRALMLCTDGIDDPFYPMRRHAATIFRQLYHGVVEKEESFRLQKPHAPIVGQPEATASLSDWLLFEKKGENDDRTILILHRDPVGEVGGDFVSGDPPLTAATKPSEPGPSAETQASPSGSSLAQPPAATALADEKTEPSAPETVSSVSAPTEKQDSPDESTNPPPTPPV